MPSVPRRAFDPYHTWLGIPPEEQPPNHYRLLGVALFESQPEVIASAADRQMGHLRAFQSGKHSALSQQLLNEVGAARVCLLAPARKATYDEQLRESSSASVEAGPVNPSEWASTVGKTASASRVLDGVKKRSTQAGPTLAVIGTCVLLFVGLFVWYSTQQTSRSIRRTAVTRTVNEDRSVPQVAEQISRHPDVRVRQAIVQADVASVPPQSPAPFAAQPAHEPSATRKKPARRATPPASPNKGEAPTADGEAVSFTDAVAKLTIGPPAASTPTIEKPTADKPAVDKGPEEEAAKHVKPPKSSPAQNNKRRPPDEATQIKITTELGKMYDLAHVKVAEKAALAQQMLQAVQNTQSNPDEQFVLLEQAAQLAADAGDAATMVQAYEMLADQFEGDQLGKMGESLVGCANNARSTDDIGSLVIHARRVIAEVVAAQRYELALELSGAVYRACQRSPGKDFRKEAAGQRDWVQDYCRLQQQRQLAEAAIAGNPSDVKAHLTLGRYYCFTEGEWERGLPHLAKGDDAELRTLAKQELESPPDNPEDRIKLAEAWWDLAQSREGTERDALLLRAGHWYDLARPGVTSALTRLKVEKRLAELVEIRQRHTIEKQRIFRSETGSAQSLWSSPF